ncbi:MAG TPA: hypothetical protein VFK48_04825 [Usitatibacter sp.]|nr:hypothetical protein [Usitatibacter sp.]
MIPDGRNRAAVAAIVVFSAVFAVAAHVALVDGVPRSVGAALSLVPIGALVLWQVRRSRHRALAAALAALLALALWLGWDRYSRHFPDVFFLEHAGVNLALAFVFGRTLVGGQEALVTRFARILHETLPPEVERYTRGVTIAWTIFFVSLFTASCVLYLGGFIAAWSTLANLLSPVLIGTMFVVEYAVRHRFLPHWHRVGILGSVRAFSRHFSSARVEAGR